jgi:hypothetical protein
MSNIRMFTDALHSLLFTNGSKAHAAHYTLQNTSKTFSGMAI